MRGMFSLRSLQPSHVLLGAIVAFSYSGFAHGQQCKPFIGGIQSLETFYCQQAVPIPAVELFVFGSCDAPCLGVDRITVEFVDVCNNQVEFVVLKDHDCQNFRPNSKRHRHGNQAGFERHYYDALLRRRDGIMLWNCSQQRRGRRRRALLCRCGIRADAVDVGTHPTRRAISFTCRIQARTTKADP